MDSDQAKLFVGGIWWGTNEEALKEHFSKYGEVVSAVIIRDRNTGSNRGFGFVCFADPSAQERALHEKHVVSGRQLEVKKAIPRGEQHQRQNQHQQNRGYRRTNSTINDNGESNGNDNNQWRTKKIFVGGLAATLTSEDFRNYFSKFGEIVDVVVMFDSQTRRPRGFGFITFDSEEAVENVVKESFHELNGKRVEVKRAIPKDGENNGNNGNGYSNGSRMGARRGSGFGAYGGGAYTPYGPRYGVHQNYAYPPIPLYSNMSRYPYGGAVYGGAYTMGGPYSYGYMVPPRSPWNGHDMDAARQSAVAYRSPVIYPGYLNGGYGYGGLMYPGALGNATNGNAGSLMSPSSEVGHTQHEPDGRLKP